MNNLIIGSSGFLGKRLCLFLKNKGQSVVEFDIKNGYQFDARSVDLPLDGVDRVYFLAWDVGGAKYLYNKECQIMQMEWNSQLMNNVFPQIKKIPFVFISSQLSEKVDSVYGVQKRTGEVWSKIYNQGASVRLWNLYGYIEEFSERSHVVSDFVFQALKYGKIEMMTDGSEKRQFIHIDDVCEGLLQSFNLKEKDYTYDITSKDWISVYEVAKIIQENTGCDIIRGINSGETVFIENKKTIPGWNTQISLRDGIKKMIEETKYEWGI